LFFSKNKKVDKGVDNSKLRELLRETRKNDVKKFGVKHKRLYFCTRFPELEHVGMQVFSEGWQNEIFERMDR